MNASPSTIDQLLFPLTLKEFNDSVFDKYHTLLLPNTSRFPFINVDDIKYVLSELDIPISSIDLARDGSPIEKSAYSAGNFANRDEIWNLFREGCTIIFRAADRWLPNLRSACASISDDLRMRLQANIYLTPESNYSSPPHFDPHHLFILQIEGDKKWNIYEGNYEKPRIQDRFDNRIHEVGPIKEEIVLTSGNLLYLPRGIIHKPLSISNSVHVALGFSRLCVSDCLAFLCGIAGKELAHFRNHVDVGGTTEAIADQLSEQLSIFAKEICSAENLQQLAELLEARRGTSAF